MVLTDVDVRWWILVAIPDHQVRMDDGVPACCPWLAGSAVAAHVTTGLVLCIDDTIVVYGV